MNEFGSNEIDNETFEVILETLILVMLFSQRFDVKRKYPTNKV